MMSSVPGKVISVTKAKWRDERTIGEATIVLDHEKVFWKPNGDVGLVSCPAVENDCLEEEDRGGHEMGAAGEDDNEGHDDVNEASPKVQAGR